jgi:hypothetical protein
VVGPLFLLVGCGSSTGGELRRTPPPGSTETGNPPVIDVGRIALVVMRDEVHVTGEDGAVSPAGSELEVETLSSGDVAHGKSDSHGGFDIQVDGTIDDTYRLRAFGAAKDVESAPVYLSRGGASVGTGDGGTSVGDGGIFSCEQRASIIDDQLTQAANAADHACSTNTDCTMVTAPVECPGWVCSGAALSQTGASEVAPGLDAIKDGACQEFKDAGCRLSLADCGSPSPAACVEGRCVDCAKDDCSAASCDPCDTPEIIWAPTGPMIGDAHTIVDCKTLVTNFADGSPQCSTTLPCTTSRGRPWSFSHVQNLLGDPAVKAALAADMSFGPITPAGFGTRVTIGAHAIDMSSPSCGNAQNCTEPPLPVQNLFALLDSIAIDQSCATGPNPGEACDMPFDPGTGSQSIGAFAFDDAIGNCIPKTYSGAGGNGNRFDSFESCQTACPPTALADTCASDRTFVANACLQCGVAGGCMPAGEACMRRCTDNTQCTDDYRFCGADGTCGLGGCD